jgi:hypothetical protein
VADAVATATATATNRVGDDDLECYLEGQIDSHIGWPSSNQ